MPATLEPPPVRTRKASLSEEVAPYRRRRTWAERLVRSGYFVGAVLVHLVIFLLVATWVVFQPPKPPAEEPVAKFIRVPQRPPHSPPHLEISHLPFPSSFTPQSPNIIISAGSVSPFHVPIPHPGTNLGPSLPGTATDLGPRTPPRNGLEPRLPGILEGIEKGQDRTLDNIRAASGDASKYVGRVHVYLASYAGGDWNCNVVMKDGAIVAGSLPDLIAKMQEWSHGNMQGLVEPTPLNIGGPDLMNKMPPFIFFTGHKDFVLTDAEISNLRAYLQNGGAIWGDNALPGQGSRFDVAFHREMKRVIPDKDKNFEDVPITDKIFTSWFNLSDVAQGMNFYSEPLQHLDIDGKVAILYTPNDYSDLFCMEILPGDTAMGDTWVMPGGSPLYTNGAFLWNSSLFFRNFTLPSSLQAQKLGMNIISYLLVRFDSDLLLSP